MNNGRMTFRFDVNQDKPWPKEEPAGGSVYVEADHEAAEQAKPQDEYVLEHGWVYEPEPLSLQRNVPKAPFRRSPEVSDARWQAGKEPPAEPAPVQGRETFFRQGPTVNLWEPSRPAFSPLEKAEEDWPMLGEEPPAQRGYDPAPERYAHDDPAPGGGYGGAYHSRRPSYWWKFALSVTGALATGLLLGYTALSFFSGGGFPGTGGGTAVPDGAAVQNSGTANGTNAGQAGTANGNAGAAGIPVSIAAQHYYLLQYGVFSSPDGAEQARKELLGAGLAAGVDPADGNRVYAGLSPDREQAKLLSGGLKNQGIELYVREVALPSADHLAFAGSAAAAESYFTASGELLGGLSSLSASLLSTGQVDAAGTAGISDLHMQWKEAAKALEQSLPPELQTLCASLEKSMSQGISALGEYNKSKAGGLLWEVQGAMMNFLTAQKQLMTALGAGTV